MSLKPSPRNPPSLNLLLVFDHNNEKVATPPASFRRWLRLSQEEDVCNAPSLVTKTGDFLAPFGLYSAVAPCPLPVVDSPSLWWEGGFPSSVKHIFSKSFPLPSYRLCLLCFLWNDFLVSENLSQCSNHFLILISSHSYHWPLASLESDSPASARAEQL